MNPKAIETLKANWREELVVARVYRALAQSEVNTRRKDLLGRMAASEEEHAALWAGRLAQLGVTVDPKEAECDFRKQRRLLKAFGPDAMIRRIEREERHHVAEYQAQVAALGDPLCAAILERVIPDERAHAERLRAMGKPDPQSPRSRLDALLAREPWHAHGAGTWIGDAIYGINDGLGAVFGIVSAVAGATSASPKFVLIAGLAGMIGSAFSMGSSAYLAAKSEREVHEAQVERERREIETDPAVQREQLELMYEIKGFAPDEVKVLADRLTGSPDLFLETMVREKLGFSEERLPNPWLSAVVGGVSTAIGAFFPVLPFFWMSGVPAVMVSLAISIVAHFLVGASKTFITGRSWLAQGLEMTFVGMLGGALAYGFGRLVGAHGGLN